MTYLAPDETFVMLENSLDSTGVSWLYRDPLRVVDCREAADFEECLAALQAGVSSGLYAAGWFSYEAGYLQEQRLAQLLPSERQVPLMWFGLFERRERLDSRQAEHFWREQGRGRQAELGPLAAAISEQDYKEKIEAIQASLAAGDVYQVNYTFPLTADVQGDPACLHAAMRKAQPVAWGAYIQTPEFAVSCHSPELFFEKRGTAMRLRPMKGTAARGRWPEEDLQQRDWLVADEKSQAENLMIVDLERNDLSRLADPGSVEVASLFEPEVYRSIIQMTSTVLGQVAADLPIQQVLSALFPCGSVTGAPKIRAMELIRDLETSPRGIYTGAIGHMAPNGDMVFNVPIRTMTIDGAGQATLGIGSGIVADSDAAAEFQECLLKSNFARPQAVPPCLIETIRWRQDEGYWLLDEHLSRLGASAQYFGYAFNTEAAEQQLSHHGQALMEAAAHDEETWRVRLLLSPAGEISIKSVLMSQIQPPGSTVALARQRVNSGDVYLFHKTTRRQDFDQAYIQEAEAAGHRDVIFLNERGELTEGTRHNLFVQIGDTIYTPPVACGLLAGTFRSLLIRRADSPVKERVMRLNDLQCADKIFLGNSISGLIPVDYSKNI
jgi:para-aminobenzoate synthetase / 4-amino-4-deoxychorismate lyase